MLSGPPAVALMKRRTRPQGNPYGALVTFLASHITGIGEEPKPEEPQ